MWNGGTIKAAAILWGVAYLERVVGRKEPGALASQVISWGGDGDQQLIVGSCEKRRARCSASESNRTVLGKVGPWDVVCEPSGEISLEQVRSCWTVGGESVLLAWGNESYPPVWDGHMSGREVEEKYQG